MTHIGPTPEVREALDAIPLSTEDEIKRIRKGMGFLNCELIANALVFIGGLVAPVEPDSYGGRPGLDETQVTAIASTGVLAVALVVGCGAMGHLGNKANALENNNESQDTAVVTS